MIDLHNHVLPEVDDGASSLDIALQMAQMWCDDGVTVVACTPHILPGVYANTGEHISRDVESLQFALALKGSPLRLVAGADNHMVPDFVAGLRRGHLLPLAGSRYVLVEPPHNVRPPRIEQFFFDLAVAGYVPILTHPERLTWIETGYDIVQSLARSGVWMQLTAGSLTGQFGRRPRYWAERMLDDGLVHILASDAHGVDRRRPSLGDGYRAAAIRIGENEASHLVKTRPQGILDNVVPHNLPLPLGLGATSGVSNGDVRREGGDRKSSTIKAQSRPGRIAVGRGGFAQRLRRVFDR